MEDFKDRLKKARDALSLSQNAAAKKGGVSQSLWNRYESGKVIVPPYTFIEALARMGINANWLLTGIGDILFKNYETRRIPLISYAGAGTLDVDEPLTYEDQHDLTLPDSLTLPKGVVYAIQVKGESMLPHFHDRDVVVVCEEEKPKNGRDYVFVADGKTWLKTYHRLGDRIELRSHNNIKPILVQKRLRAFKILYCLHTYRPQE